MLTFVGAVFVGPSQCPRHSAGRDRDLCSAEEAADWHADAAVRDGNRRIRDAVHIRLCVAALVLQMVNKQQGSCHN